jgi:DNA segregation ATPase FtsK/SpoIIIE, S-DNA-T family
MSGPPEFRPGPRNLMKAPTREVTLPDPGPVPRLQEVSLLSTLLPAGLMLTGIAALAIISSAQGNSQFMLLSVVVSLPLILGTTIVSLWNYRSRKKVYNNKLAERELKYEAHLEEKKSELESLRRDSLTALQHCDPDLSECLELVRNKDRRRLWARGSKAEDYLNLRLGLGKVPFQVAITAPKQASTLEPDPLIEKAQSLKDEYREIKDAPISLDLKSAAVAGIVGPKEFLVDTACKITAQIATHHSPLETKIIALFPPTDEEAWAWMRWLPHVWSNDRRQRFMASDPDGVNRLLAYFSQEINRRNQALEVNRDGILQRGWPSLIFLIADMGMLEGQHALPSILNGGKKVDIFSIFLSDHVDTLPSQCQTVISQKEELVGEIRAHGENIPVPFLPDPFPANLRTARSYGDAVGRFLAPLRFKATSSSDEMPTLVSLLDAFGVQRVEELEVLDRWENNDPYHSLAVPVGCRAGGELQLIDLHEKKDKADIDRGHGPNALVAGTVGSGKSVLLKSWVASLASSFHPHELTFVLLDLKPPGLAEDLRRLPHVVNTIDLDDLAAVPRALISLEQELARRGRLFKRAGVDHIDDYMDKHRKGQAEALELIPYLVLIVDEFTVLKQKLPDTMEKFEQVAIRGRAFGFRMILATQKPTGVISGQVDSNTSLRLCLSVATPQDSHEMIRRDYAASLASSGRTYMRFGMDEPPQVLVQFQAAYCKTPYVIEDENSQAEEQVFEVRLGGERIPLGPAANQGHTEGIETELDAIVSYIVEESNRANIHRLRGPWLEVLPTRVTLDEIRPSQGWNGQSWQSNDRWLRPVIGLRDDPWNQERPLLEPDLGQRGHLFICSRVPASSRLALRTLITSMICDHSPDQLQLYCLDFSGLGLAAFGSLPHVGDIITKQEKRRVRVLLRYLKDEVSIRQQWLSKHGIDSLTAARDRQLDAPLPPAILLVIDSLAAFLNDPDRMDDLADLARDGQIVGIHLLIVGDLTANRLSSRILNSVDLRIALQLGDPADYRDVLGGYHDALAIPAGTLGRGMCKDRSVLECQIAFPTEGQNSSEEDAALGELAAKMSQSARRAGYRLPKPIPELPDLVELSQLISPDALAKQADTDSFNTITAPIGLDLDHIFQLPAHFDLVTEGPHLMIAGPSRGGKTTAMISFVLALASKYGRESVEFVLLDTLKGSLKSLASLPQVRSYAVEEGEIRETLRDLRDLFQARRDARLRPALPAIVAVVDDYDLMSSNNVTDALSDHAERDHFFGFHLVVAQSSASLIGGWDRLRKLLKAGGSAVIVGSHDVTGDLGALNITPAADQPREALKPGRGYLVRRGRPTFVQVATPGGDGAIDEWVARISSAHQASGA